MKTLIKDLLTENKYWTFSSSDWTTRINVYWKGKTKWKDVEKEMVRILGNGCVHERQVQLKDPDMTFE